MLPLLERLRTVCIITVALDWIFIFVFTLSFFTSQHTTETVECFHHHHYQWHNLVSFSFAVSAVVAVGGILVHSQIVCCGRPSSGSLAKVFVITTILVSWAFVSCVLEAVAINERPAECGDRTVLSARERDTERAGYLTWQAIHTMLWLSWIGACVLVAVFSRQTLPSLILLETATNDMRPPQTMGVPVFFAGGASASQGVPTGEIATGMPVGYRGKVDGEPAAAHPGDPPTKPSSTQGN